MKTDLESFLAEPVRRVDLGTELCYRRFGRGPAVVLVHGWPLNGATYRGLVRILARQFTCYVPDLPGAGLSPWDPRTRDIFTDYGALLVRFVDALELPRVALIGHDSGGAMARVAAAELGERVSILGLIDTEVANHVPRLIALYQGILRVPGSSALVASLARARWYRRSRFGLGACFADIEHLEGEFHQACVEPFLERTEDALRTLRHADLTMSKRLTALHRRIHAPVALVWGDQDPFFPVAHARAMQHEFPNSLGLRELPGQGLLVHDEQPALVADALLPHLLRLHALPMTSSAPEA
jgi:pimeloyl-ACP methyl ester carboxylesterase